jgi:peptide/nickel transport system substrate-binding protein
VLKLRKGVRFSNGAEFTAEDVLFTFSGERMLARDALMNGREYFGHLEQVEALDPYTVRFTTKGPDLIFEQRLATYGAWIVSKKAYEDAGRAALPNGDRKAQLKAGLDFYLRNPIGTGPYKFKEWREGRHIELVANDEYFGGKPAAGRVFFREIPELSTRIAALVSGEVDMIVNVDPDQFDVLAGYKDIVVKSVPLNNTHVIVFNVFDPVLKDKRVRQALSLAIDRKAMIDSLWHGKAVTPNGHQLPEFGPMYLPDRKGYVFDRARARRLLGEAGYKGEEVTIRFIPNYYQLGTEAMQIVQQQWKEAGVNAKLVALENFPQVRAAGLQTYAWSQTFRLPDPAGAILILWSRESATEVQYKHWKTTPEFNRWADALLTGATMKERAEAFPKLLDVFEDEMPMTMLYNPLESYAMKKGVEWTPYPLYYMDLRADVLKSVKK